VLREKYLASLGDALRGKPGWTYDRLAFTTVANLPPDVEVEVPDPNPKKPPSRRRFRFKAVDDPLEGNDAHAEVQAARGTDGAVRPVPSHSIREHLRVALALRFRVLDRL
jgi:hypothetical protein